MKKFSIIIPVYNEEKRIRYLLESINKLDYPKEFYEVIVVNDGSSDRSRNIVEEFSFVKLINFQKNRGRFFARKKGAESAKYENLFFLDARSIVDKNALTMLNKNNKYKIIIGHSLGKDNPNAFETFYSAIRRLFFGEIPKTIIEINKNNFDKKPKGTGALFVKKNLWLAACEHIDKPNKNLSDDTKLLSFIVQKEKIAIDPSVKIINFARTSFAESIKHLFYRGIKFLDYYLDIKKRNFWLVIVAPPLIMIAIFLGILLIAVEPLVQLLFLFLIYLSTILILSTNFVSFLKLLWISPLIIITFYLGLFWGMIQKFLQRKIISFILTIGFLGFLIYYFINHPDVILSIRKISLWQFIFLFLLQSIIIFIYGIINHIVIRKIQTNVPFIDNIALQFTNQFLNKIVPKGGAAFRSIYLKEMYQFPYSKFISTISGMYVISFASYSIAAFITFGLTYLNFGKFNIYFILAFLGIFIFSILLIILPTHFFSDKKGRNFQILNSILEGWSIIKQDISFVIMLVIMTISILFINTYQLQIIYHSLGFETSYLSLLFLSIVSLLTVFINITPDGIGIKEGIFAFSSGIVAIPPDFLILGSLIERAIGIFISISFGGLSYFWLLKVFNKQKALSKE